MYRYIPLLLLVILSACQKETEQVFKPLEEYPDLLSEGVTMRYYDSASLEIIIRTPKQVRLRTQDEVFPKGMNVEFYKGSDSIQSTMVCDSAFYHKKEAYWSFFGDVEVDNRKEKRNLKSQYLEWRPEIEEVYTDKPVVIISEGQQINGKGLRAKEDFSEYEILNVTGIIDLSE